MNFKDNEKSSQLFYTIPDDYINKLKRADSRVQNNYRGNRLYFKTNLKVENDYEDINYYVPLSSAKESQKAITNLSMFKLYGDKEKNDFLGVLHVNNMIPVPDNIAQQWSPSEKDIDERYTILVVKQMKYLKKHQSEVMESCDILYRSKKGTIDKDYFRSNRKDVMTYKKIMTDVSSLEPLSINIGKDNKLKAIQSNKLEME